MELVAPAGNAEKFSVALHYGADAVYLGLDAFNLRTQADNFSQDEIRQAVTTAHSMGRKTYLTLNAFIHDNDTAALRSMLMEIRDIPFDGFIIADVGMFSILKDVIPNAAVHVSTQANVGNTDAVRFWERLGVKRVILARELSLDDIKRIRDNVTVSLEVFAHGAMCVAYSGRCLISNYLTGRDANRGDCTQPCRWDYRLLEERSRPGELFPVIDGDGFTSVLSSKDLNMAEHLDKLRDAGVDAVKIEGRIKSVYYVATVVRVYRKLIDGLKSGVMFQNFIAEKNVRDYIDELSQVSHREYDTGFFFRETSSRGIQPTMQSYLPGRKLMAMVTEGGTRARIKIYNTITDGMTLTAIGRDYLKRELHDYKLFTARDGVCAPGVAAKINEDSYIETTAGLATYDILTLSE
ncbi:MAG: U32 family peptidase [Spirochaetes bacterium]|nr:U32 family peptidase [Spirochaetota bacterium]